MAKTLVVVFILTLALLGGLGWYSRMVYLAISPVDYYDQS